LLSISFSRIYLGVHFPIDIAGGWAVGLILWGVYVMLLPRIERLAKNCSPAAILITGQCALLLLVIIFPFPTVVMMIAAASGIEWGVFLNKIFFTFVAPPIGKFEFWIRALIGPAGIFMLYISLASLPLFHSKLAIFALFFLTGLWISLIANAICNKISVKLHTNHSD